MDDTQEPDAQSTLGAEKLKKLGAKWLERIRASEKREDAWTNDAKKAEKAFLADSEAEGGKLYDFNILHSNIETLAPAVYNSSPIPEIRERFRSGQETPETAIAQAVAQVIERALLVQVDDGALDVEMEDLTQDGLVAGRGIIRVRFEADEQPGPPVLDEMGQLTIGQPVIVNERLTYEAVSWRDYREGPAKRWKDVPWVAFRQCIAWEEVDRIQDPEIKEALSQGGYERNTGDEEDTLIWEIWDRETGRVYMIVEHSGEVIGIMDDPLGLKGFFPCPKPVEPIKAVGKRTPVVPFAIYRQLAEELENLTRRIKAITKGLKVRGLIAGDAASLEALADADDNTLIPIANLEGLAQTGGLDKAITWWPVDKAVQVLRELYVSRDQTKQMIYEVTGISDIVRGQGEASETATAQKIKSDWGGLRIRKLQRMIERCARDLLVLSSELISSKFSPQTLQAMTGIQINEQMAQMLSQPLDNYRIDVETDSTVRADLSRRKGEMTQFLEGTAAFFGTMAPVIQQSPDMAEPITEIYASFARQFNLGKQAEDAVENMASLAKQAAEQAKQMQAQQMAQAQEQQQQAQAMEAAKLQSETELNQDKLVLEEKKAEIDGLKALADMENSNG